MDSRNIFWIAPMVVMAAGLLPLPYGYYTLLKMVVCGCSVYYAFVLFGKEDTVSTLIFGFLAVLYNPVVPIHLGAKEVWIAVNAVTAVLFLMKRKAVTGGEEEK